MIYIEDEGRIKKKKNQNENEEWTMKPNGKMQIESIMEEWKTEDKRTKKLITGKIKEKNKKVIYVVSCQPF